MWKCHHKCGRSSGHKRYLDLGTIRNFFLKSLYCGFWDIPSSFKKRSNSKKIIMCTVWWIICFIFLNSEVSSRFLLLFLLDCVLDVTGLFQGHIRRCWIQLLSLHQKGIVSLEFMTADSLSYNWAVCGNKTRIS